MPRPFWIARDEVLQEEWEQVMGFNRSRVQRPGLPVERTTWFEALKFCERVSEANPGLRFTLPTEAQWEYACRAGTKTAYAWGDNPDDGKGWANAADQSLKKKLPNAPAAWKFFSWDDGFVFTSPVGSFKANTFGLYDMNGNAWQWCQDHYGDYEKGAATDPTGADTGALRVLHGGSWINGPRRCRSAYRLRLSPVSRCGGIGFRVAVAAGVDLP
jgi:formylglycine-generating enzyme required for sulfatase activity